MPEKLTLLPCPACGGEADIIDAFERDGKGHVAIGWSAYCTRGCLITSERGSREEAAALWSALPRAMTWTTEQPKVPGYYWCRYKGSGKDTWSPAYIPAVADLTQFGGLEESEQVEWAGPIPEPREPKEQGGYDG